MKRTITNENSNNYRRVKHSLFGDVSGKIKTFAIISPQNPLGFEKSDDETFKQKFLDWTANKSKYNRDALKNMKSELIAKQIELTGDKALQIGGFNYVQVKGSYGEKEKTLMIFNLPLADAKIIARDYGQESFFFGKVYDDHSDIAYYKTENACQSYKLVEITDTITDETDAEDFFSKFGLKFRINMKEFGDEIKEITNDGEFEESMNEASTFMSRANHRKNS